jgi:hypothetical protein
MNDTTRALRELNDRLDLPQPAKARVLLEVAADLRELEEHFVGEGLTRGEASRRALERCDLSDEVVSDLVRVHTSVYRRFLDRLGGRAQTRWERTLLVVALAFVVATTGRLVVSAEIFAVAGTPLWLAAVLALGAFVIFARKLHAVYLKQDHDTTRLRRGLSALPLLAGGVVVVGACAHWFGLYVVARRVAADPGSLAVQWMGWLHRSSAALVVCLFVGVVIAVAWFVLATKVGRIEEAEASVLLE